MALKILHADDTPHAIALGAAIATFVAFLPLIGFQTAIAITIAALFRANKVVCVPFVWITNVFTLWPIYYGCYLLGRLILPAGSPEDAEKVSHLVELAKTGSMFEKSYWLELMTLLAGLGIELWVGCAVVGASLGLAAYFLVRSGVVSYRERRRRRMLRRSLFRATRRGTSVAGKSEPI